MTINKQAMRQSAEKAQEHGVFNMDIHSETVLALLGELEAADALNKHLELAIRKADGCSEALRRKAEAAEKRIAELEAREVTLPPTFWYEHDDLSREVPVLDKRLVKKALRAAGITVKGDSE